MSTMTITSCDPISKFPSWMSGSWEITWVNSVQPNPSPSFAAVAAEGVTFISSDPRAESWGSLDPIISTLETTVSGVTSWGQKFQIYFDGKRLICQVDPLLRPHWGPAVVLGASVATLIGAAVGMVAGFPRSAFVAIPLVASIASGATRYFGGQTHPVLNGSNATWIANDGGAGSQKDQQRTAPTLKAVSANAQS
jgi:hypothetical protein